MIYVIFQKELASYFKSSLAYVIAGLFSLIVGWVFFNLLMEFLNHTQNLPAQMKGQWGFVNGVVLKLMSNINFIFLFISPIISMKLVAQEKNEGTIDLFFSAPMREYQLVIGKYLASVVVGIFLIATTFLFPIILLMANFSDFQLLASGYFGLLLNLMCYLAVGLFASSVTDNQIIAALLSFVLILFLWLMTWVSQATSHYFVMNICQYLSVVGHFNNLMLGLWKTSDFIYYITFIFFFLFLSKKTFEARYW